MGQLREWMLQVLRMTTLRKPRKMMMPAHSVDSLMPKKRRKTRLLRLPSGDSASSRQNSLASHWKRRMSTQEPRRRLTPARRLRRDLRKRKIMEKMVYSNKKKDAEAEKLRAKRRKIEKSG